MPKKKTYANNNQGPKLTPKTPRQQEYIEAIQSYDQVICLGPAGTGKSYIPAVMASQGLVEKRFEKVVVTRPNEGAGRSIGFLTGDKDEKMEPWCLPILDTMKESIGKGHFEAYLSNGKIEMVPLELIRGRSFENSFVILDEAQNCNIDQLKAFVTRQGEGSKLS